METSPQTTAASVLDLVDLVAAIPDVEPGELPDAQAHEELMMLMALKSLLEAKIARRAHQWRVDGTWTNDGSRSAQGRLARETGCHPSTAERLLGLGKSITAMPATAAAWRDGRLSTDKVALLVAANTPKRAELFARDEALLVGEVARFRYSQAVKIVKTWQGCADREVDPDGTPPPPETYAKVSRSFEGCVVVDAVMDPVGGEIYMNELARFEAEMYKADLAEGRNRTATERRAAAMVEMAMRSGTAPKDGKRPEPLICIVAGEKAFEHTCESLSGTVLHPTLLGPYLTESQVQSFIYDGVHDITKASRVRTFRGTLRRAIQVRDRHCQHPSGCDIPATRCDGDHYPVGFADGGETSMKNGRAMCDRHNRNAQLRDLAPAEPVPNYQPELLEPLLEPPPPDDESPPGAVPLRRGREVTVAVPDPVHHPQLDLRPDRDPPTRAPDMQFGTQSVWFDYALAA